ncbi:hypothetical protein SKAU_G00170970 [Synaphobranchus kaupii]|uniref:Uncharacterized protein n=1 Tax=Synaphobranchus kaupii TaxID=118154 RepID=A0A9Q1J0U9_SYNKA|nr:hypothetical protein SKAU_G00170970 [Synaphobranchus kaupii]
MTVSSSERTRCIDQRQIASYRTDCDTVSSKSSYCVRLPEGREYRRRHGRRAPKMTPCAAGQAAVHYERGEPSASREQSAASRNRRDLAHRGKSGERMGAWSRSQSLDVSPESPYLSSQCRDGG